MPLPEDDLTLPRLHNAVQSGSVVIPLTLVVVRIVVDGGRGAAAELWDGQFATLEEQPVVNDLLQFKSPAFASVSMRVLDIENESITLTESVDPIAVKRLRVQIQDA